MGYEHKNYTIIFVLYYWMTNEFILKWDSEEEKLIGEDPETEDKEPINFEQLSIDGDGPIEGIDESALDASNILTGGGDGGLSYGGLINVNEDYTITQANSIYIYSLILLT